MHKRVFACLSVASVCTHTWCMCMYLCIAVGTYAHTRVTGVQIHLAHVCAHDAEQLTVVLSPVQAPSESLGAVGGLFSPSRVQWSGLCPPPLHMHQERGQAGCCEPPRCQPQLPPKKLQ